MRDFGGALLRAPGRTEIVITSRSRGTPFLSASNGQAALLSPAIFASLRRLLRASSMAARRPRRCRLPMWRMSFSSSAFRPCCSRPSLWPSCCRCDEHLQTQLLISGDYTQNLVLRCQWRFINSLPGNHRPKIRFNPLCRYRGLPCSPSFCAFLALDFGHRCRSRMCSRSWQPPMALCSAGRALARNYGPNIGMPSGPAARRALALHHFGFRSDSRYGSSSARSQKTPVRYFCPSPVSVIARFQNFSTTTASQ